jgi:hypothetical protein
MRQNARHFLLSSKYDKCRIAGAAGEFYIAAMPPLPRGKDLRQISSTGETTLHNEKNSMEWL